MLTHTNTHVISTEARTFLSLEFPGGSDSKASARNEGDPGQEDPL